jgi:hypothetical protein
MNENDSVWMEYADRVQKEMVPRLADSSACISIAPFDGGEGDVKYWVELGASIMMDKPIMIVAAPGSELPAKLIRVADLVVYVDITTDVGQQELSERVALFIAQVVENDD